jgi:hypothetical protein
MLKLGKNKEGNNFTSEELAEISLEAVQSIIEKQVPGAFDKEKAPAKKAQHQRLRQQKPLQPPLKKLQLSLRNKEMQAIILAAGLGTRLKPLTDNLPKALVRCAGKPLIDHAIDYLVRQGIGYILVNVSHGDVLKEYIEGKQYPVPVVISDETAELKRHGWCAGSCLALDEEKEYINI